MVKRPHSPSTSTTSSTNSSIHPNHTNKRACDRPEPTSASNATSGAAASNTMPNAGVPGEGTSIAAGSVSSDSQVDQLVKSLQDARDIDEKVRELKDTIVDEKHARDKFAQLQAKSKVSVMRLEEAIHKLVEQRQEDSQQPALQSLWQLVQQLSQHTVQPPLCPTDQLPPYLTDQHPLLPTIQAHPCPIIKLPPHSTVQFPPHATVQLSSLLTVQPHSCQAKHKPEHQSECEPACKPTRKTARKPEREPKREPTHQSECKPVHKPAHEPECKPECKLARKPEHEPTCKPEHRPVRQTAIKTTRQVAQQLFPMAESSRRASGRDSADRSILRLSDSTFQVTSKITKAHVYPGYTPRRALLHQFAGTDYQAVVAYGEENLQIWNPARNMLVGTLDRDSEKNLIIEQVKPVAPSVLAMVSGGLETRNCVRLAGELHFSKVNWSRQKNEFSVVLSKPWVPDAKSGGRISVVEGANPVGSGNNTQVTLFTGSCSNGLAGGSVYRRIFDISGSLIEKVDERKMDTQHSGRVSALCHMEAKNYVVSGNTRGGIFCSDHVLGTHTQGSSVGNRTSVGSITGCPFSPDLFMVGCHQLNDQLLIYDNRDRLDVGKPKLVLKEDDCTFQSLYSCPAWNADTGLIFAPMHRFASGRLTGIINVWDPRYVKSGLTAQLEIPQDKSDTLSVDITRSAVGSNPIMVTASTSSIAFTTLSCNSI